jgi:hypothetical protein
MREQDQKARERLLALLAVQGRQADAVAETLAPWLKKAWVWSWRASLLEGSLVGYVSPEALRTIQDVYQWVHTAFLGAESRRFYGFLGWPSIDWDNYGLGRSLGEAYVWQAPLGRAYIGTAVHAGRDFRSIRWSDIHDLGRAGVSYTRGQINHIVRCLYGHLKWLARRLQEYQLHGQLHLVNPPADVHPPRYGTFEDGMLARLLSEDLAAQIDAGRALEASLADGARTELSVPAWTKNVARVLSGLTKPVGEGFARLTSDVDACDHPLITDADALGLAYLALGLAYLKEVQERMSDYAEASGQESPEPRVSMTFSGGTFYGGQFAAQIANIDSTIAGVVQQGSPDVADALKALEQAVLSQEDLNEEERRDLLDNVGYLAEAAQTPPEERNRGIVKSVLAALNAAATRGVELQNAMAAWGGVLNGLVS